MTPKERKQIVDLAEKALEAGLGIQDKTEYSSDINSEAEKLVELAHHIMSLVDEDAKATSNNPRSE